MLLPKYETKSNKFLKENLFISLKLIINLRENIKFKLYFLSKNIGKIAYNLIVTVTM